MKSKIKACEEINLISKYIETMKYTLNILMLLALSMLVSCTTPTSPTTPDTTVSEEVVSEEVTGSVMLELQNPAQLAGETLNFEVSIEAITKWSEEWKADVVENGDSIEVHYTGTLVNGEKFDSSYDRDQTLPFTVGAGQMISGFDTGVVGMALGETKNLVLSPEEAYGPATITESVTIAELRDFVGPDFEIAVGATIPTAWGDATIIELQD